MSPPRRRSLPPTRRPAPVRGAISGRDGPRREQPPRRSSVEHDLGGDQIEGVQAVRELLRARRRKVFDITVSVDDESSLALREIVTLAAGLGVRVRHVPQSEIHRLAASEVPQGVVARAEKIVPVPLSRLAETTTVRPFLVVLDGVTDPQNLGAAMRTALSAGATGLVLPRQRAARLTPSAMKAAAGAAEHLPIAFVAGVPGALQTLRGAGVWSVGLDEAGRTDLDDVELFTEPVALVLGAEGPGLAPLTRQRCDLLARIDLVGPLASINVAAATAVACFAVARRRRSVAD